MESKYCFDPSYYPDEFTGLILSFLGFKDLVRARQTCRTWNKIGTNLQYTDPRLLKAQFWLRYNEFIQVEEKGEPCF